MDAKKILFIAQEITPYLPESEIATICRNLRKEFRNAVAKSELSCLNLVTLMNVATNYMK